MTKVHPDRENSGETMTVSELIEALRQFPAELPVIATWEGVGAGFRLDNFSEVEHERRDVLAIDVENYG